MIQSSFSPFVALPSTRMQGGYYQDAPPPEWLVMRKMDRYSNQFNVLSRASFNDPRNFDNLIFSGEASVVHPSFYYICRGIDQVAGDYSHIDPRIAHTIKRGLYECAQQSNIDFARQRGRFLIFEHFARMASRRLLVADHVASLPMWSSHEEVLTLEADVMASWYDWFVRDGLHRNNEEIGFRCEVSRHYIELQAHEFE